MHDCICCTFAIICGNTGDGEKRVEPIFDELSWGQASSSLPFYCTFIRNPGMGSSVYLALRCLFCWQLYCPKWSPVVALYVLKLKKVFICLTQKIQALCPEYLCVCACVCAHVRIHTHTIICPNMAQFGKEVLKESIQIIRIGLELIGSYKQNTDFLSSADKPGRDKIAILQPGRESPQEIELAGCLIWIFLPELWKNNFHWLNIWSTVFCYRNLNSYVFSVYQWTYSISSCEFQVPDWFINISEFLLL